MKLHARFSLATGVVVAFTLALICVFFYWSEQAHLRKSLEDQQRTSIEKFARVCRESSVANNDVLLVNYIKALKEDPALAYAMLMDLRGQILMHSDLSQLGLHPTDARSQALPALESLSRQELRDPHTGEPMIDLALPVLTATQQPVGVARLGYRAEVIENHIRETLISSLRRLGGLVLAAFLVAFLVSYALAANITRPVRVLEHGARLVGAGKLTHRIELKRADELGALAHEFNDMAQRLAELDQMKDDFVSSVTHELRSPLSAIKGYVDLMLRGQGGELSAKHKEYLHVVKLSTDRLGHFIDDMLDLAKLQAGLMEFTIEPVDMQEILEEARLLFRPTCDQHQIAMEVQASRPQIVAMGDREKISQVVTNLASNALKFTPDKGKIVLWVKEDSQNVLGGVTDNGVGIPKDSLEKVFNKFEQVKQTKNQVRRTTGTGLGLAICRSIVEALGGRIWVESELEKGSTFCFTLPRPTAAGLTKETRQVSWGRAMGPVRPAHQRMSPWG